MAQPYVIGVTGRSGSGKTSLVRLIQQAYGPERVTIHTMDNYYKSSDDQCLDEKGIKNFDLPDSFVKSKFCDDLKKLAAGEDILIRTYDYTIEGSSDEVVIKSAPVVIVEGLFIYHYEEVSSLLDYKVMVDLPLDIAYERRLKRDVEERNYTEEETHYRYMGHVEPAYIKYISPHKTSMDLLVDNRESLDEGLRVIRDKIDEQI